MPLSVGGAGSPSHTVSLGLRPTSVPSGIVNDSSNHLAQYTNITDRQDNGSVAYGEPLLVTVAPKLNITFGDLMFALFLLLPVLLLLA